MGGLEWVAFTGNIGLVNSFHRLGLKPVTLCAADPERLGERQHWGSYYESKPWVHVGNIRAGFIHLRNIGLFTRLGLPTSIEEPAMSPELQRFQETLRDHAGAMTTHRPVGRHAETGLRHAVRRGAVSPGAPAR
jgi:hypothetical protein